MSTDFINLWLTEACTEMRDKASRIERSYGLLQNKESNYGRAHALLAKAYRQSEQVFADALSGQNSGEQS